MFARRLNVLKRRGAYATAAVTTLILGSACKSIDCYCPSDSFAVVARGANVVPPATDTTPTGVVTFDAASLVYTYNVTTQPAGTIDSIALYEVARENPLPALASAILCAGAAACAATSGTATVVPPATASMIRTSMRAYGTQLVFFTTTAQKAAGGAMRGTIYQLP